MGEEAFYRGEAAAEGAGVDLELELGAFEGAGFGLEDVASEVGGVLDLEDDFLAELGDLAAGFDVVGAVAAVVADGGHEDDLLEVWDVHHFHVGCARVHAAGAAGWEAVYFVGDDFAVGGEAWVGEVGCVLGAVAEAERGVLLGGADEFALFPLAYAVFEIGCDEGVAGWVVDIEAEGECGAGEHGAAFGDDFAYFFGDFGGLFLASFLVHFEVVNDGAEEALDVGELATARGDLEIHLDEFDRCRVGFDHLPGEVFECGETQLVVCSFWLHRAGGLDLVVLGVAVVAGEGHDDYFAEVGNHCEEKTGDALEDLYVSIANSVQVLKGIVLVL